MRVLDIGGIPTSLGEIINIKFYLDLVKDQYDRINISFQRSLWDIALHTEAPGWNDKKVLWENLLSDLGKLFFSEHPYVLESVSNSYAGSVDMIAKRLNLPPQRARLAHLLCKGVPLNVDNYVVITTKVRELDYSIIASSIHQLWDVLRELSSKCKIVILGERVVEMRKEYGNKHVFGLYDAIINNLPKENLIDLTIPALGETVSSLAQIQQDCLIMKEAKFVITLGAGGNFCLSTAVSDMTIGFRADKIEFADLIFNREYSDAIITKNWAYFIELLKRYSNAMPTM